MDFAWPRLAAELARLAERSGFGHAALPACLDLSPPADRGGWHLHCGPVETAEDFTTVR